MIKIADNKLDNITGGATLNITSTLLNSIAKITEVVFEIGNSFGSSFRRIEENNICPLK